jgi:hypothetical protein
VSDPPDNPNRWALTAQRICATAFPGEQLIVAKGGIDSQTAKSVTAACPSGTRVIGGGAGLESNEVGTVPCVA